MNFSTQKGTGLWPLMLVLALWAVLMAQAVGVWRAPRQAEGVSLCPSWCAIQPTAAP